LQDLLPKPKTPEEDKKSMSENQPFVTSQADEDPEILRARFQEWGYLLLKKYVPEQRCNALMKDILETATDHISFNNSEQLPELSGEPFSETDPAWDEVYPRIQALENFHSFFHEPLVLNLMRTVVNDEVFVYPIKMARISTPGKIGYETPPHQDAHSHNAGPTMAGFWLALHDVSTEMGRVKVLPKSHLRGKRPIHEALGVGGVQCEIYDDESTWHVSDFEQGDVLIFHSCCVHKAEPNQSKRTARISVDTRFCDHGAPVFSTNLEPHHGWRIPALDWQYIYRNWQSTELQYYWRDYPGLF
jgi:ectoine hydroxylase-related dioxygenase (phytanoyl-CoA dioxygenase family)